MRILFFVASLCLVLAQNNTDNEPTISPTSTAALNTTSTIPPISTSAPTNSSLPSREDCKKDIATFCPAEEGYQRCRCLKDHLDELSPNCAAFVRAKAAAREEARAACGSDARKLCRYYLGGNYLALGGCLMAHSEELSEECQTFIQQKISEIPSDACDADVAALCSNSTGFSAQLTCINGQMQNVSENCRKLIFVSTPKEMFTHGPKPEMHERHERHDKHDKHKYKHMYRTAKKMCGADAKQFCSAEFENGPQAIRACLNEHYSELSEKCSSFLDAVANGEYSVDEDDDEDGHHHGKVGVVIVFIAIAVVLLCCCKRRCKRRWRDRRLMWEQYRLMQMGQMGTPMQPMSPNTQTQPTQMVAVPVQVAHSASQQTPQVSTQQTVMYAAAPYTGTSYTGTYTGTPYTGTPYTGTAYPNQLLSASPMTYNP